MMRLISPRSTPSAGEGARETDSRPSSVTGCGDYDATCSSPLQLHSYHGLLTEHPAQSLDPLLGALLQRRCAEYAKLGLMGITVLYSSGDDGVAGNDSVCLSPNNKGLLDIIPDDHLITDCQVHRPPVERFPTPASLGLVPTSHLSVQRW